MTDRLAGFERDRPEFTRDNIVEALRAVYRRDGSFPRNHSKVRLPILKCSLSSLLKRLSKWKKVGRDPLNGQQLRELMAEIEGRDYRGKAGTFTRQEIVRALKATYQRDGRFPTTRSNVVLPILNCQVCSLRSRLSNWKRAGRDPLDGQQIGELIAELKREAGPA